jgi:dihydrofolate reductase
MAKLTYEVSMSLDGHTAGPNADMENPLGIGGEQLHEWAFELESFKRPHGMPGGRKGGPENQMIDEALASYGAMIMGRKMFSGGEGPWESDPNADAWWGDNPPFHIPVFVLTHHPRETMEMEGGTTFHFVTDGFESALEQATEAAGEKNVGVAGGASVAQQYLKAGRLDELMIHLVPVLLGGGVRLFENLGPEQPVLERTKVLEGPVATHLRYRVVR